MCVRLRVALGRGVPAGGAGLGGWPQGEGGPAMIDMIPAFTSVAIDVITRVPEPELCDECVARKPQIVDLLARLAELRGPEMKLRELRDDLGLLERMVESCPGPRGGAR